MRDVRTPDLILAGQTRHCRARTTDPLPLDYPDPLAGACKMPRQQLATLATAEN
jgi:hypothetical protein